MTHVLVDVGFGGTIADPANIPWTDISEFVDIKTAGVSVTRGASDEISEIQPATCTLSLDNADGRFTPGLATSPYYPNVKKNVPIRVAVATLDTPSGSAPYPLEQLADDFDDNRIDTALWPATTGTVSEVGGRARVATVPGPSSGYISDRKWTLQGSRTTVRLVTVPAGGDARANVMILAVTSGTRIGFDYSASTNTLACRNEVGFSDGSAVNLTYDPDVHRWLRVREASGTVYWETSANGYSWTVRRSLAAPAWVGTDQVRLQLVASRTTGTTDYAEFDLVGARAHARFIGMVNDWPVTWAGLQSKVTITATDLFKWLSRQPKLQPLVIEEILADAPVACYTLAEPDSSGAAGDLAGQGATSLTMAQIGSGGELAFGSGTGPPASGLSAVQFTPASSSAGKFLQGDLGQVVEDATTAHPLVVEGWFTTTVPGRTILGMGSTNGDYQVIFGLDSGTGALQIRRTNSGQPVPAFANTITGSGDLADGVPHHFVYDKTDGGVYVDGEQIATVPIFALLGMRSLSVGAYTDGRLWDGSIACIALYADGTATAADLLAHYPAGATGFAGETALARIQRLAGYAAIGTVDVGGSTFDAIASQGEGGDTVLALMQQVAATEGALLYANRDGYVLALESRDRRYNPAADFLISYEDLETGETEISDDDQKMVNTVVATRPGGATQRVVDQAARTTYGPYEQPLDLLKTTDNKVLDAANWTVSRYADPPPELRQFAVEAYTFGTFSYRGLLALGLNVIVEITDLPAESTTSTQTVFIEGYTETITHNQHRMSFHCSRSFNDAVWVLNDTTYSVLGATTRLAY